MNAKAVGLASGENSHQYLLLLFGINTEGILLSCRTVKIVDNKVFHLIWVLADMVQTFRRFRLSMALSTTVHFKIIPRIQ